VLVIRSFAPTLLQISLLLFPNITTDKLVYNHQGEFSSSIYCRPTDSYFRDVNTMRDLVLFSYK